MLELNKQLVFSGIDLLKIVAKGEQGNFIWFQEEFEVAQANNRDGFFALGSINFWQGSSEHLFPKNKPKLPLGILNSILG